MYFDENDDYAPHSLSRNSRGAVNYLSSYLGISRPSNSLEFVDSSAFVCPSDIYGTIVEQMVTSYSANAHVVSFIDTKGKISADTKDQKPLKVSSFKSSGTFLFKDSVYFQVATGGSYPTTAWKWNFSFAGGAQTTVPQTEFMPNWHSGKTNLSFLDGHVGTMDYNLPNAPASVAAATAENSIWGVLSDKTVL
jgi:prepilin-type processing-associated H-X9-DG protein